MNKNKKYTLVCITILLLIIKTLFFNFESNDYKLFLSNWIAIMKNNGGILSLKNSFTDYNYPYLVFLSILSYLPIKPIYLIKALSLLFDLLIALLGYKFVYKYSSNKENNSIIAYILLLLSPIIFLNSCIWGQCDSIYSFFVLLSLYYLCDEKINKSFISLGIAFSLKLQSIFIFPLFVIMYFCNKKIKIYHFLIIPLTNFIMCIPAYIVGGSPLYTYKTYLFQTKEYLLKCYTSNMYAFLSNNPNLIFVGIFLTLTIFIILLNYYIKKDNINSYNIIDLGLLSIFICYLFLPSMHQRYSYLIDVLTIIWVFIYSKKYYISIFTNLCSIILYLGFLAQIIIPRIIYQYLAIMYYVYFIIYLKEIIQKFKNNSTKPTIVN